MMVGRVFVFLVLTGACQFGHGVGGFTTDFIHSSTALFLMLKPVVASPGCAGILAAKAPLGIWAGSWWEHRSGRGAGMGDARGAGWRRCNGPAHNGPRDDDNKNQQQKMGPKHVAGRANRSSASKALERRARLERRVLARRVVMSYRALQTSFVSGIPAGYPGVSEAGFL